MVGAYGAAYDEGSEPGTTLSYACSAGSLSNWIHREFGAVCFDLSSAATIRATASRTVFPATFLPRAVPATWPGSRASPGRSEPQREGGTRLFGLPAGV